MAKQKYYVVWQGLAPGVYETWDECRVQIEGFRGARYKAFPSKEQAVRAFREGVSEYDAVLAGFSQALRNAPEEGASAAPVSKPATPAVPKPAPRRAPVRKQILGSKINPGYIEESLAVDAACSGNPGRMEYRGVYVKTGQEVFHVGPYEEGTNNIGEFLAIVHGLALLEQKGVQLPIYSDSANALLWVKLKKCRTKLEQTAVNRPIFQLIARAEQWLHTHRYTIPLHKWETKKWGEIPADFGRK